MQNPIFLEPNSERKWKKYGLSEQTIHILESEGFNSFKRIDLLDLDFACSQIGYIDGVPTFERCEFLKLIKDRQKRKDLLWETIITKKTYLLQNMRISRVVIRLYSDEILGKSDVGIIKSVNKGLDELDALLDVLKKKVIFSDFLVALRKSSYTHVADHLESISKNIMN